MSNKKFSLIGIVLCAFMLLSAEAALAGTHHWVWVPEIYLFSSPYSKGSFPRIDPARLKNGVAMTKGSKFFLGISAKNLGDMALQCQFTLELRAIRGKSTSPDGVKITDINGKELKYERSQRSYKTIKFSPIWAFKPDVDDPKENFNYHQVFIDMTDATRNTEYIFRIHMTCSALQGSATISDIKFICESSVQEKPSIDAPQTIMIMQDGMGSATFTGKNITSWYYKPDDVKDKGVESVTFEHLDSSNACRATVKLNTKAVENSTIDIPIRALNVYGDETSSTLTVNVHTDEDHRIPIVDGNKSIEIIAGGTGTATFTGQNIKNWNYDKDSLPSFISGVDMKYADNPNTCEVLVAVKDEIASLNKEGDVKIYAYNGAGRRIETPANLHVKVTLARNTLLLQLTGTKQLRYCKAEL